MAGSFFSVGVSERRKRTHRSLDSHGGWDLIGWPGMADMSDIEDGFALKPLRKKARARGKKQRRTPRGAHTIPPPPVKHILGSFTLANPTSKRAVCD